MIGVEMGDDDKTDIVRGGSHVPEHGLRRRVRIQVRAKHRTIEPQGGSSRSARDLRSHAGIDKAQTSLLQINQAISDGQPDDLQPCASPDEPGKHIDMRAVEKLHDASPPEKVRRKPSSNPIFGRHPISFRMADKSSVWLNASKPAE